MFENSPGSTTTVRGSKLHIARLRLRHARGQHIPASKLTVTPTGDEKFSVICFFCGVPIANRVVSPESKAALRRENIQARAKR